MGRRGERGRAGVCCCVGGPRGYSGLGPRERGRWESAGPEKEVDWVGFSMEVWVGPGLSLGPVRFWFLFSFSSSISFPFSISNSNSSLMNSKKFEFKP